MYTAAWQTPPETSFPIEEYTWRTDVEDRAPATRGTLVIDVTDASRVLYAPVTRKQFRMLKQADGEEFDDLLFALLQVTASFDLEGDEAAPRTPLHDVENIDDIVATEASGRMTIYVPSVLRRTYEEWLAQQEQDAHDLIGVDRGVMHEATLLTAMQHPETFRETARHLRDKRDEG